MQVTANATEELNMPDPPEPAKVGDAQIADIVFKKTAPIQPFALSFVAARRVFNPAVCAFVNDQGTGQSRLLRMRLLLSQRLVLIASSFRHDLA